MQKHTNPKTARARELRKSPTWAELRLWEALRRRRLGAKFRRQHPVGRFFADFASLTPRLVVEVDGATHDFESPGRRSQRDAYLRAKGFAVLHFTDEVIYEELEGVVVVIRRTLADPDYQWIHERHPW